MTFEAYIDTIKAKTGKTPEDFLRLARAKGLLAPGVKTTQIVNWLKDDYGLGRGHAMALVLTFKTATEAPTPHGDAIARHFSGKRARWRATYDELVTAARSFGPGVSVGPTGTYLSLLRDGRKFAVVAVTAERIDIGLKLKGARLSKRFEPAGEWNSMVTHRVRITDPKQIDEQVLTRLHEAYSAA